jgi:hypothetical protein
MMQVIVCDISEGKHVVTAQVELSINNIFLSNNNLIVIAVLKKH